MSTVDQQAQLAFSKILNIGTQTEGRTTQDRIRLLDGMEFEYGCADNKMSVFSLRKNNPKLAVAETMAFLMGATHVSHLELAHPALKLWEAWASKNGNLGGVYGDAFKTQYPKIVKGLKVDPNSSHHRMTTLIPNNFPKPGRSYNDNVAHGSFSLMPCLHSYHFLSDGKNLWLHATQASGDMPVGVFPHNAYQVQFMLLLTAHLTGLTPMCVKHHVHDTHIYVNQVDSVTEMINRRYSKQRIELGFDLKLEEIHLGNLSAIFDMVNVPEIETQEAIKMEVDS